MKYFFSQTNRHRLSPQSLEKQEVLKLNAEKLKKPKRMINQHQMKLSKISNQRKVFLRKFPNSIQLLKRMEA